jgi:hypothetical protein
MPPSIRVRFYNALSARSEAVAGVITLDNEPLRVTLLAAEQLVLSIETEAIVTGVAKRTRFGVAWN